ncbi:RNase P protein subunit [Tieghemostelium lacteum]|uniref:RNase P protein subunit n=1 Tax=Tieghemostelium lacteum TaxID=361077 RepID=A0A152A2V6_TIELA|nr:RNase P protein subunit [Tieghemostelium lacteum]|eukprot:KYR00540.1 RNase P protein subunit [Tieghemostelium lacteum]
MSIIGHDVPNSKIIFKRFNIKNEDHYNKFSSTVHGHWFNQKLQMILPIKDDGNVKSKGSLLSKINTNRLSIENEVIKYFSGDSTYHKENLFYYQIECTLDLLLEDNFIKEYIKGGGFYGISQFNFIDSGNVVAFIPDGKIVLSLEKDTYQQLGLVGKKSSIRNNNRYIVTLDTHDFQSTSKNYQHIITCLRDRISTINLIVYSLDPKSLKLRAIQFPKGVLSKVHQMKPTQFFKKYRIPLPPKPIQPEFKSSQKEIRESQLMEWNELLGYISCDIEWQLESTDEDPSSKVSECFVGTLNGFISNHVALDLVSKMKEWIDEGWIEYGCINLLGFTDTPISWKNIEHGYDLAAENDNSIVILPKGEYWISSFSSSIDNYS